MIEYKLWYFTSIKVKKSEIDGERPQNKTNPADALILDFHLQTWYRYLCVSKEIYGFNSQKNARNQRPCVKRPYCKIEILFNVYLAELVRIDGILPECFQYLCSSAALYSKVSSVSAGFLKDNVLEEENMVSVLQQINPNIWITTTKNHTETNIFTSIH